MLVYLGLGSNIGDRYKNIFDALEHLKNENGIKVGQKSRLCETVHHGGPEQPDYLNAVVEINTDKEPEDLLRICLDIEKRMGRIRKEKNGPRNIDIDILFYGNSVIEKADLKIPHPLLQKREFVLFPLYEIAPNLFHPVLKMTVKEMKERLPENGIIKLYEKNI